MLLGISSHAYAWAIGVTGYPKPVQPLTVMKLLQRAAELELRVLQIADNLPLHVLNAAEIDQLRHDAESLGVDLEIGTSGIDAKHLRDYLQLAIRLKSPIVRTLLDTPEREPTADEVIGALRGLLAEYESAGICLAIENHDRFPAATLVRIIEDLRSSSVGICLDTANSLGCGEGIEQIVEQLGPWAVNLHVKDFQIKRPDHKKGFVVQGCPAGTGLLDIPWLLSTIQSFGRSANAIIETWVPPDATLEETIAKEAAWAEESVQNMRRWLPT
jgi:sugar phosphate isomerase/epimerase